MRKSSVFLLVLLFALTSIGCDSTEDDDPSDAEIFVGTWTLVGLSDDEGDKLALFGQVANGFTATLRGDNTFHVLVDYIQQDDLEIAGTYTVNEDATTLVLSIGTQNPAFDYQIENENRIVLFAPAVIVNTLFQTSAYVGQVRITIQRT